MTLGPSSCILPPCQDTPLRRTPLRPPKGKQTGEPSGFVDINSPVLRDTLLMGSEHLISCE